MPVFMFPVGHYYMAIFKNKFFSVAGQKERLANVGKTVVSAVSPGGKVQSNTGLSIIDKPLSAVASHPFISAGVAAAAVTYAPAAVAALRTAVPSVSTAAATGGSLSLGRTAGIAAAAATGGLLIGSSLGGKGGEGGAGGTAQTAPQTQTPTQTTSASQEQTQNPSIAPTQTGGYISQTGSGFLSYSPQQNTNTYSYQISNQDVIPLQETAAAQEASGGMGGEGGEAGTGMSPLLIAALIGGAYILTR